MPLPLNIDWQQILLHLLNFAILAFGLYFILYKPVKKIMDERQDKYRKMDQDAKDKLAKAEETRAEYEAQLQKAQAEIHEKEAASERLMNEKQMKAEEDARKIADQIIADARVQAKADHDKLISDAQSEICDMTARAAEQLVMKSVSDSYDDFLKAAERSEEDA